MNKELLYKVTRTDGAIHENLTYDEAFEYMVDGQWDLIHFMNPDAYDWRKDSE
jgi:hypothetical protein